MKLTRLAVAAAAAAVTGLLLSACGGPNAAASAVVIGSESVSNTTLSTFVADVHRQREQPVDQVDAKTTTAALNRLIIENLVAQSAAKLGVTVTDAEVQSVILKAEADYGGRDGLVADLLNSDIPESNLEDAFRMSIRLQKMGGVLLPDGEMQAQQQAVYEYVFNLAAELKPEVNPRFGTWNQEGLKVGDLPTDLSIPVDDVPAITPTTAGQ